MIIKHEVIEILNKEIEWHLKDNKKCIGLSKDWKDGFVKGIIHSKNLINKIEEDEWVTYLVDSKVKDIGNGIKKRTIKIKKV